MQLITCNNLKKSPMLTTAMDKSMVLNITIMAPNMALRPRYQPSNKKSEPTGAMI